MMGIVEEEEWSVGRGGAHCTEDPFMIESIRGEKGRHFVRFSSILKSR